ncbi:MAG: c-type cytochrome domain-containing protein [Myxococcota bacterium]
MVRLNLSTNLHRPGSLSVALCVTLSGCILAVEDRKDTGGLGDGAGEDPDGTLDGGSGESGGGTYDGGDGGGPGGDVDPTNDCDAVQSAAVDVLDRHCAGCHNPESNAAGFGFATDVEKLIISGKVVPGDASSSPVFARMIGGSMPPPSIPDRPSDDDVSIVGAWIDSCLLDAPETCDDQDPISTDQMIDVMLADIATVPPTDRLFTRYLTLTHLYNVGYCLEDLDQFRFGLSKSINSLSLDPIITRPQPIDAEETIYRIDLRDYDWEAAQGIDKWELLVDNNPYAVRLLDDDAQVLQQFTGTFVPFMAADWFVHDSAEPPLYYDMVDIPGTMSQLEAQLGINISANIATFEVERAGFLNSGVSQSNRVFERHQLPFAGNASLWVSYDFETSEGAQNIFANPLDFQENGGEAIFNLPNGMQAYIITDAQGNRLDEAPINIVTDPLQEDKVVRAGISCMSCHDSGLKVKSDEIRDYVAASLDFDATTKEIVEQLHPRASEMSTIIDLGSQTFLQAVTAAWDGPVENVEPIIEVYARFDGNVDLERAAAEFGVSPNALLSQLGQLDPTYAPLVTGVISREAFEAKFAESVCILNLGLANDPACF